MNTATSDTTMPFEDLERAYETLARAIDRAGPAHEALFLTRLALVLAHRTGRRDLFEQAIATAMEDMDWVSKPMRARVDPADKHAAHDAMDERPP